MPFSVAEEARALGAVGDAVVHRQRHLHPAARPSPGRLPTTGDLAHGADRQDRGLGRVDDGRELLDAHHAEVRDGEGRAGVLVRLQAPVAGALGQFARLGRDVDQRLRVGVANHRGDQAVLERDRQADVHARVLLDVIAGERRVDLRVPLQRRRRTP